MKWVELDEKTVGELEKLLASEPCSGAGVILRLAWHAGLMRDEIHALRWEQVDFGRGLLRLSDREVPMDGELARCLRQWQTLVGSDCPYVAFSEHKRTHMLPQSISRLARGTLDRAGLTEVRLADLHYNYILRLSAQRGWQETVRSAGLSIATYRSQPRYRGARSSARETAPSPALPHGGEAERERLRAVLKENRPSPAGLALWLYCQTGLQYTEIAALTWEQVDLARGRLCLAGREEALPAELTDTLRELRAARTPDDDPHILLSPKARRPIPRARLSNLTKELLARNGLASDLPARLRADTESGEREGKTLEYAARHGSISVGDCMALLGLTESAARALLGRLSAEGRLMRDHRVYRPAGAKTTAEQRETAIRGYLAAHGACDAAELSEALGMSRRTVQRAIEPMAARGEIAKEPSAAGGALRYTLRIP